MADNENIQDLMSAISKAKADLEKAMLTSLIDFEKNTGLTVYDMDLIRTIRMGVQGDTSVLAAIKLDMRLD